MRAFPKDRTQLASAFNSVTIERYRVTYVRADGRNVPGVDVPYPFDGAVNFLIPVTTDEITEVERGFVIVRHQAKGAKPRRLMKSSTRRTTIIAVMNAATKPTAITATLSAVKASRFRQAS